MSTLYFTNPAHRTALMQELERWKGTRFSAQVRRAKPQVCCDCVTFVEGVLTGIGAMRPIVWPRYVISGGGAGMLALLLRSMDAIPELQRDWTGDRNHQPQSFEFGDVLLCTSGTALHHLALFVGDNTVWHAIANYGVTTGNVHDPIIRNHIRAIYRVYE